MKKKQLEIEVSIYPLNFRMKDNARKLRAAFIHLSEIALEYGIFVESIDFVHNPDFDRRKKIPRI